MQALAEVQFEGRDVSYVYVHKHNGEYCISQDGDTCRTFDPLSRDYIKILAIIEFPETYDFALPEWWVDMVRESTGEDPGGHFVWSYDNMVDGEPHAITRKGRTLLSRVRM
jgi:hypothetical protein